MSLKLYKITVRSGEVYYAVSTDPTEAYNAVRAKLDDRGWATESEREMLSIELIAEAVTYPSCECLLIL